MKTKVECLPCLLRQTIQVARLSNCSEKNNFHLLQSVSRLLAELDETKSPPANAAPIYSKIAQITGCDDPYLEKKKSSMEEALAHLPELREEIRGKDNELVSAIRFAIAGNIIDFGALETFDIEATLKRSRTEELAVDHIGAFIDTINTLPKGAKVLYLADNCGEIVYDSLLVENLFDRGLDMTVAVKEGPIINDALLEDGYSAGLNNFGRIISNGTRCPGTVLEECSPEFLEYFDSADLIISKGQGNFESLSQVKREIFFLLTIKCAVAGRHMAKLSGVALERLPGRGEMAVYHSNISRII
ncbi:MAG: damage-control phosphatase ARMT1 family protein [Desulforhopalus sp.]